MGSSELVATRLTLRAGQGLEVLAADRVGGRRVSWSRMRRNQSESAKAGRGCMTAALAKN